MSVHNICVIIGLFVFVVNSDGTCYPGYCNMVKCVSAKPEECTSTQRFQEIDVDNCICCSKCVECDPKICFTTLCMNIGPSNCTIGQKFVPRDGNCKCCSSCQNCDPTFCQRVRCISSTKEECRKKGEILAPRDGLCHCCDYCKKDCSTVRCANVNEYQCKTGEKFVPADDHNCCSYCKKKKNCDPTFCQRVDCKPSTKEECKKKGEILAPSDGIRHCCDYCKKDCSIVRCANVTKYQCKTGEKFVPADDHNCCSYCKEKNTRCKESKPTLNCAAVQCLRVGPENCKKGQEFLQGNGKTTCCNACVDKPK